MVLENSGNKSSALGLQYEPENLDRVFQIAVRGLGLYVPPSGGELEILPGRGGIFLPGEGNLRRSDFDNSNPFQSLKQLSMKTEYQLK